MTGSLSARTLKRDMIDDAIAEIDMSNMPEKGEPIPTRPSERDTIVTPTPEDSADAAPAIYEETYELVPEATKDTYGEVAPEASDNDEYSEVVPELSEGLSKRGLFDDFSKTVPEFEDSYEEIVPEVTSAAYEAKPTPSAYEAIPTPADAYHALPTPSEVYEVKPTPSEVYGAVPVKPSKVYEAAPTPTKGAYQSLPTPAKDTYESTPIEDSYEELDLDFDIFRKN